MRPILLSNPIAQYRIASHGVASCRIVTHSLPSHASPAVIHHGRATRTVTTSERADLCFRPSFLVGAIVGDEVGCLMGRRWFGRRERIGSLQGRVDRQGARLLLLRRLVPSPKIRVRPSVCPCTALLPILVLDPRAIALPSTLAPSPGRRLAPLRRVSRTGRPQLRLRAPVQCAPSSGLWLFSRHHVTRAGMDWSRRPVSVPQTLERAARVPVLRTGARHSTHDARLDKIRRLTAIDHLGTPHVTYPSRSKQ